MKEDGAVVEVGKPLNQGHLGSWGGRNGHNWYYPEAPDPQTSKEKGVGKTESVRF